MWIIFYSETTSDELCGKVNGRAIDEGEGDRIDEDV